VDLHFMAEDVPTPLPDKVKVGVVGKVYRAVGVYLGLVIGDEFPGFGQAVTYRGFEVTGVAFIPIGTFQLKPDKDAIRFLIRLGLPEKLVKAPAAAVEAVLPVIFIKIAGLTVQGKGRPAYTVTDTADGGAEKRVVMGITVQGGIAQEYVIGYPGTAGGNPEPGPGGPQGGDGEGQIPR
jgi:hypothetical protein